jgi:NitT/TauT family transport system permease protein
MRIQRRPSFFGYRLHVRPRAKIPPYFADLVLLVLALGIAWGASLYARQFFGPYQEKIEIDISPWHLPKYTFFSLCRGLAAYLCSFVFGLLWGLWAAKDRVAEKILIPLLDVLQSIPFLGFLPGFVLLLVNLFHKTNMGLELAAIGLIFTAQAWNMAFGVYHAIRTIPEDKTECAAAYEITGWQKFHWIELPATALSLVWNSIMSMAGGWFFLMVNEAYQLGHRSFRLPGLGSYMSIAAAEENTGAMIWAILAMIALIVFLDQILWRPLVVWSQKFRLEETGPSVVTETWFLNVLKNSYFLLALRRLFHVASKSMQNFMQHREAKRGFAMKLISRVLLIALLCLLLIAVGFVTLLVKDVSFSQWLHLGKLFLLTLGRVIVCLCLGVLVALPLGLFVGLSEKWSGLLEPFIQVGASFPATLLFPIAILFFAAAGIPLGIGSIFLMLMGSFWYVFLNVIAGAKAMPSDLREVAANFTLNRRQRFLFLHLPAVFPYLVTGLVTASGGAWNASIVSEYVSYKNQTLTTPGIGSSISLAAQNNDMPLLAASLVVLVVVVVSMNLAVWLRLYHYSEKRFAINA